MTTPMHRYHSRIVDPKIVAVLMYMREVFTAQDVLLIAQNIVRAEIRNQSDAPAYGSARRITDVLNHHFSDPLTQQHLEWGIGLSNIFESPVQDAPRITRLRFRI